MAVKELYTKQVQRLSLRERAPHPLRLQGLMVATWDCRGKVVVSFAKHLNTAEHVTSLPMILPFLFVSLGFRSCI